MGKIIASTNVTLDGVVQDPTGEEGFRHGGWFLQGSSNDREAFNQAALTEALGAEALLLGRRSYQFLAERWPSRTGELADRLNSMPKYVVSSTLEHGDWHNSIVLNGDTVSMVLELKQRISGEIVVPASRQLFTTLIENELVDELRLMVYPQVLGDGERLFGATADKIPLHLRAATAVGDGLAFLTYEIGPDTMSAK
jgi:dihydrofolate reductase